MDNITHLKDLPSDTIYIILKFLNFNDIFNFFTFSKLNINKELSKNRDFWMNYIDQIFENSYKMLSNKSLTDLMKIAKCFSTPGNIYVCGSNFKGHLALLRTIDNVNKFTQITTTNNIEKIYNIHDRIFYVTSFGDCFMKINDNKILLVPVKSVKQICLYYKNDYIINIIIFLTHCGTCYNMTNYNINSLKVIPGLPKISKITGKLYNVLFLTDEGKVYGLGSNYGNQLGLDQDIKYVNSTTYMSLKNIVHIDSTNHITVFSTNNNDIYSIGRMPLELLEKNNIQLTLNSNYFDKNFNNIKYFGNYGKIRKISCGSEHTAILMEDGRLYMFGIGRCGQLGLGDTENRNNLELIKNGQNIIDVACGYHHTTYITIEGELFTFGSNEYNQLGLNQLKNLGSITSPQQVMYLQNNMVKAISCKYSSTLIMI